MSDGIVAEQPLLRYRHFVAAQDGDFEVIPYRAGLEILIIDGSPSHGTPLC